MLLNILRLDIGALLRKKLIQSQNTKETFSTLDINKVMKAHIAWLERLKGVIEGSNQEVLDVSVVSAPNKCELGMWIYQDNAELLMQNPDYVQLRSVHKEFHILAGNVLIQASTGDMESATKILKGDLRKCSDKIQLSLIRLHSQTKQ